MYVTHPCIESAWSPKLKSRHKKVKQSISQNPYFFHGFIGFFVPSVAHAFLFRMLSNKSAAYPEGFLDRGTLKSFYAISGPEDGLVYTPGNERIPENWYTRAVGDQYDVLRLLFDFKALVQEHPEILAFGGNTGTVNSFTGLDVTNLTVSFPSSALCILDSISSEQAHLICGTGRRIQCRNATSRQQPRVLPLPIGRSGGARSDSGYRCHCGRVGRGGQGEQRGYPGSKRARVSAVEPI